LRLRWTYDKQWTGAIREIRRELAVGRSHHQNVVKRWGELTTADIHVPLLDRNSAWIHTAKEVKNNKCTKFDVYISTHYKDIKGNAKCGKWGCLEQSRVTQGH